MLKKRPLRADSTIGARFRLLWWGPTISCPLPHSDGHCIVSKRKKNQQKTPHNVSAAASVTPPTFTPLSRQPFQLFNCYRIIKSYYVGFHSRINFPKILLNSCFFFLYLVCVCVCLYCQCALFVSVSLKTSESLTSASVAGL